MRMMCGALAALMLSACASAPQANDPWATLTARDVEAAYQLLVDDHPAMSPEISAAAFRADVEHRSKFFHVIIWGVIPVALHAEIL